jgi:hypothetical protein
MVGSALSRRSVVRCNVVVAVLEDVSLPIPEHGTIVLVKGHGPVLFYQIAEYDTRILIDVQNPLPSNLKVSKLLMLNFQKLGRLLSSFKLYYMLYYALNGRYSLVFSILYALSLLPA